MSPPSYSQLYAQLSLQKDATLRVALPWALFSLLTIVIVLRLWARWLSRNLGLDDAFTVITYLLFLAENSLVTYLVQTGLSRLTRNLLDLSIPQIEWIYMFYFVTFDISIFVTGLGKVAVGITILRIFGDASLWQRWAVWAVLILNVVVSFIDFGVITFPCGDPTLTWSLNRPTTVRCISTKVQLDISHATNAVQIVADFAFSIFPIIVVWNLNMTRRRKVLIITALGLTLITGVAAIVKTIYTIYPNATVQRYIWFHIEATLVIVCGSVPTLHPLYERLISRRRRSHNLQDSSKPQSDGENQGAFQSHMNEDLSQISLNRFSAHQRHHDHSSFEATD
ncbi:hypothetical protein F4777DRAFT_571853 [Nemania sp. FL0916]|nr:hypothetical protein F4777DRAFT_571853 [Nemania sp. FL0916]